MTSSRRQCRQGSPCEPRNLAEAIYCCAHHSGLDIATIAERLGVSRSYLYDATNPDREDTQFQARLLVPLMAVTGNLSPLRFLARSFDVAVVELPASGGQGADDIRQAFMRVVREIGEDSAAIESALSDGHVSTNEAVRVTREISETVETLMAVQARFRQFLPKPRARAKGRVA
jgi:hypothetical protein